MKPLNMKRAFPVGLWAMYEAEIYPSRTRRNAPNTGAITNCIVLLLCLLLCLSIGTLSMLVYTRMVEPKMISIEWSILQKTFGRNQEIQQIQVTKSDQCHNVQPELRFDCHPEDGASELACTARRCCWNASPTYPTRKSSKVPLNTPYCFYPEDWRLYQYEKANYTNRGFEGELKNIAPSFYKKDLPAIKMIATEIQTNILRVKLWDGAKSRYEPPWPTQPRSSRKFTDDSDYEFLVYQTKPGFQVRRKSSKSVIFDSASGGFIFSDQLLQISTVLPSHNIYGLGEHRTSLKLKTNWQSFTLFNKDQPPTENANLYGSHPFYMIVEDSGACHGVLFLNSNAMDVILQPSPGLTFRTIGGIFDLYFFLGPDPYDVLRQYSSIVGKPFMPPYWSLGFHLCRFGYGSLEKTREVWNRTVSAGIPLDTQWNDLDYMDNRNDFTYDKDKFKELPKFVEELHAAGMHYIPLIDSGISASEARGTYPPYDEGLRRDVLIKDAETDGPFLGKVWNHGLAAWPDFTHPKINDYWYFLMNMMHEEFQYDGAWVDMNEPSNFYNGRERGCAHNPLDNPPYTPGVIGNLLATKTLCMTAKHAKGLHYDVHNTYGMGGAVASQEALIKIRAKRPFVVSRSTWVGHGHYAAHWTGDVYSSWHDLRMSIPETLQFSLFQIPMIGADICGFDGNTTVELCNRWMQVGAFYPFSRNHNSDDTIEQDPVALGDLVVKSSKKALTIKYRLLPYLYTLFFDAHMSGSPVMSPLFLSFWKDKNTLDIDSQFLWGDSLMIVPVLEEKKTEVKAYLPEGTWYDYYNHTGIASSGQWLPLAAPADTIPLLIREGRILPAQKPAKTTTASRRNKFELIVTIAKDPTRDATGFLYWDDGDSLDSYATGNYVHQKFQVAGNKLTNAFLGAATIFAEPMILGQIEVMGWNHQVARVTVDGKSIADFSYDNSRKYLMITNVEIDLTKNFEVTW